LTPKRAYYQNTIPSFLIANTSQVLGELAIQHHFEVEMPTKNAWTEQIAQLQVHLKDCQAGEIFFEFAIPRMGRRADVVLLIDGVIFVIEFKVGAQSYDRHAIDQVVDYAIDLKNFHEGSHDKYIVPILFATKARPEPAILQFFDDSVAEPLLSNGSNLAELIRQALSKIPVQKAIDPTIWAGSGYRPTPTIVEAAQALYRNHSVEEISRSDSGATNLTQTSNCISEIINFSKNNLKKSICLVTGVPGAGKTLAGLNIATQWLNPSANDYAVFLSGNGPLVNVLREALARDDVERAEEKGEQLLKKTAASKAGAFIQNIHHFRDDALNSGFIPIEHVAVFDEAQRAWDQAHAENFMARERGLPDFAMSEPEFLISVMDRKDWCVIVCLIGGGQEINTGEAGLVGWLSALKKSFAHWDVYYSPSVIEKTYSWGQDLTRQLTSLNARRDERLHLAVSLRSFREERVSEFVAAVIEGNSELARQIHSHIRNAYPMVLTRNLQEVREWLRVKGRRDGRYGLVASSGATRLRPEGINVKEEIEPIHWFLNDKTDVRSSFYLECVATEFDIQGLELDWAGVCWDADFRRQNHEWVYHSFKGTQWQKVNGDLRRMYLANAYRVLLTRARQGMAIFVPEGNVGDPTRPPSFYDETYEFLLECGIQTIRS
jgi:hypothetical protein